MVDKTPANRIIVGVDSSEFAGLALDWAIEEAQRRAAPLHIVYVFPALHGWSMPVSPDFYAQGKAEAEIQLKGFLAEVPALDQLTNVSTEVVGGNAAEILIEMSKEAALLVVGSRGHGGFASLALGSVSTQCAQHAHCPVVVVH